VSVELARVEQIIDASQAAGRIEALLPTGTVRPRQLTARTLLLGLTLTMLDGRAALLRQVHTTLTGLPADEQHRLGVITQWNTGPHQLTYRQVEYTFALIAGALSKHTPDGNPSERLSEILDLLLEASVTVLGEPDSSSYAVDWTDQETWSKPPPKRPSHHDADDHDQAPDDPPQHTDPRPATTDAEHPAPQHDRPCADPEASWGHRRSNRSSTKDELFFGYYLQAVTIVRDEHGPEVPELARRIHLASCDHDPPRALVPVLKRMTDSGIPIGDLLADSGYSYRVPKHWALPVRQLGARLICDLHPNDRGPHATHMGAVCSNGQLYCPATPTSLLELGPLTRGANAEQTATHDKLCEELARYKIAPITRYDPDGYRRAGCPAAHGKLRCPLRPASMTLPHDRPTITTPPEHPPVCCQQQTITVPPTINAKTAQKHDYPSPQHRHSYNRRTAAERTFATITDRATNDLSHGWCRLTGLTPIALFTATALIARNLRIHDAYTARQTANQRRAALGLPPKRRKRRRQTTEDLTRTPPHRPKHHAHQRGPHPTTFRHQATIPAPANPPARDRNTSPNTANRHPTSPQQRPSTATPPRALPSGPNVNINQGQT
jgi:hypothetical protein